MSTNSPKRSLGQNFLIDPNYQRKIVDAARNGYKDQAIVEIGPGKGAITQHLAQFAKELILVEKDVDLAEELRERFQNEDHIKVVTSDFLLFDFSEIVPKNSLVVSNLPYNVSTQILIRLIENPSHFDRYILMFQKEVAGRCASQEGTKEFGILAFWAQYFCAVRKVCDVPPTAFRPRPNVMSTVLEFTRGNLDFDKDAKAFIEFVKAAFSQRRKMLRSNLKKKYPLDVLTDNSILDRRAESLTIQEMRELYLQLRQS